MISIRYILTEGVNVKTDRIISLYAPGVAIITWFYLFVMGDVFSNFVLTQGAETRPLYFGLLFALIIASLISGALIDKTGKSHEYTYLGLIFCGVVSFIALIISSPSQLFFYSLLVGAGAGVALTGLRVYLADLTEIIERGRIAGGLLFLSFVSIVLIKSFFKFTTQPLQIITLTIICIAGAISYSIKPKGIRYIKKGKKHGNETRYFFIAWVFYTAAFSLWNGFVSPHPGGHFFNLSGLLLGLLMYVGYSIAALVGGTLIDWIGRKIVIGFTFAILAISYVIYGFVSLLQPLALLLEISSWGLISAVMIFVLWGDLSKHSRGILYGATLGVFYSGFFVASYLNQVYGPVSTAKAALISSTLLIMAILSVYYSEDPLPKEKIKFREMSTYMKEIKKLKI
jgi:MFS family permease